MAVATRETTVALARRFAREIREWYADDSGGETRAHLRSRWEEMLGRNAAEFAERGHYGATNDDFDANMAMVEAWGDVVAGVEMDAGSEEHAGLINDAWALAAGNEFDDARIGAAAAATCVNCEDPAVAVVEHYADPTPGPDPVCGECHESLRKDGLLGH